MSENIRIQLKTCLLFRLSGDAYRQVIVWQQSVDHEILRHQILTRGQAMVTCLNGEPGLRRLTTLPGIGEAEPYYGTFGGAYRYTFHPLLREKELNKDGAALGGCELEVFNQMGGFAYFYPQRIEPLHLHLTGLPELVRYTNGYSGSLGENSPALYEVDPQAGEMRFRIRHPLYNVLSQWVWYGRPLNTYDFIFNPTSTGCLIRVRTRSSGMVMQLVKEEEFQ